MEEPKPPQILNFFGCESQKESAAEVDQTKEQIIFPQLFVMKGQMAAVAHNLLSDYFHSTMVKQLFQMATGYIFGSTITNWHHCF